jgi:hypothetical protein
LWCAALFGSKLIMTCTSIISRLNARRLLRNVRALVFSSCSGSFIWWQCTVLFDGDVRFYLARLCSFINRQCVVVIWLWCTILYTDDLAVTGYGKMSVALQCSLRRHIYRKNVEQHSGKSCYISSH